MHNSSQTRRLLLSLIEVSICIRPEHMEVVVKKGETLEHYKSNGEIGEGEGAKTGVAYRLKDGSMVYVPE